MFHLSRIVGLAESIEHWDILPNLNFYLHLVQDMLLPCLWQLAVYPSAIVYMMTNDGNLAYSIFAFLITLVQFYQVILLFRK